MKNLKVRQRCQVRRYRRRKFFFGLRWLLVLGAIASAASLGAGRISRLRILPMRDFEIGAFSAQGPGALWERAISQEVFSSWHNRSRFWCAVKAPGLMRDLKRRNPYIKAVRIHWPDLLIKGKARLDFTFRTPAAFSRLPGGNICWDETAFEFNCPAGLELVRLFNLQGGFEKKTLPGALQSATVFSEALPAGRHINAVERLGSQSIGYRDSEGVSYEFALADIGNPKRFELTLQRVVEVINDVQKKGEKFRYIDAILAHEGRVIISGQN